MKRAHLRTLTLAAMVLGSACCSVSTAQDSTPLKEAVAAFNEKAAAYLAPHVDQKHLSEHQLPTPLTVDEVVAAIRGWDRQKVSVDDRVFRIYQEIAETKVLPPRAQLRFTLQWWHQSGEYEDEVWRIDLDVMTSETSGYGFRVRNQTLKRRVALPPSPGYSWIVNPYSVTPAPSTPTRPMAYNTGDIMFVIDEARDGSLLATASWVPEWIDGEGHDMRAVAFDESANRYLLDRRGLGVHSSLSGDTHRMARFRLDPSQVPTGKVRHLGFETLSREGLRIASEAALRQAREKGIEILPLPHVGSRYEFTLTTTDGKVIESGRLQGKVLLIDCWASWCGPCIGEMPALKQIYDKWHPKGLEMLGVSFDENAQSAVAAHEGLQIPWSLFVVPTGKEARQLWEEAARIRGLPRYLLIDRQGVLRADLSSSPGVEEELEQNIAALFQGSSNEAGAPSRLRANPRL